MSFQMRLSNAKKLLLLFFLINSLTFLLKPNANAQATVFPNVFAYNDYRNIHHKFNELPDTANEIRPDVHVPDEQPAGCEVLTPFDFRRASESLRLNPSAAISNNSKTYRARPVIHTHLYSADLGRSARITFKLFKLVIMPLRLK
jgi:hypothetical protein